MKIVLVKETSQFRLGFDEEGNAILSVEGRPWKLIGQVTSVRALKVKRTVPSEVKKGKFRHANVVQIEVEVREVRDEEN